MPFPNTKVPAPLKMRLEVTEYAVLAEPVEVTVTIACGSTLNVPASIPEPPNDIVEDPSTLTVLKLMSSIKSEDLIW